jgi:hypothetical protein
MIKKIKLFKKLLKIIDMADNYWKDNKDKVKEVKEAISDIRGYIYDAERVIKKIGG